MLVLTRRPGESIMIGNDVVVTVLEISGEAVRVGIQAPREIAVHREEVFLMLRDANRAAASSSSSSADLSALGRAVRPKRPPG
ncbi:MAG TPA: carbon storage regulator CsrA [Acidimicrobiales bacterium]|nr:carbon storage regulator CsrA [Acidimicrobiales bacterium]